MANGEKMDEIFNFREKVFLLKKESEKVTEKYQSKKLLMKYKKWDQSSVIFFTFFAKLSSAIVFENVQVLHKLTLRPPLREYILSINRIRILNKASKLQLHAKEGSFQSSLIPNTKSPK